MKVRREMLLLAAAASLIPLASPATAQVPDNVVLNIMRECAKIDDPTARLACYDNNIRQAGGTPRAAGAVPVPGGGRAPAVPNTAQSFGIEDVRAPSQPAQPQATRTQSGRVDEISTRVSSIREREPGTYQLTMDDGAQWRFAEGVGLGYRLPRAGSTVEIERGSLGSYLLRFDDQQAVPVVRVR
jgi:hypothetical protein